MYHKFNFTNKRCDVHDNWGSAPEKKYQKILSYRLQFPFFPLWFIITGFDPTELCCCCTKYLHVCFQLIKVNQPDLVLFVGEALVGNEAVDQLVKFNQALADHSSMDNPHLIDGIVLTKFDTIDDKVSGISIPELQNF